VTTLKAKLTTDERPISHGFVEILIAKAHKEGKKAWKKKHSPETCHYGTDGFELTLRRSWLEGYHAAHEKHRHEEN
jgi:hypothetical protein